MSLTEAGRVYLDRCRQILTDIDETYQTLSASAVSTSGRLRMVAPALFAVRKLAPVLVAYRRDYPHVLLDLVLADRSVEQRRRRFPRRRRHADHRASQTNMGRVTRPAPPLA